MGLSLPQSQNEQQRQQQHARTEMGMLEYRNSVGTKKRKTKERLHYTKGI